MIYQIIEIVVWFLLGIPLTLWGAYWARQDGGGFLGDAFVAMGWILFAVGVLMVLMGIVGVARLLPITVVWR